jgi:hypothetical protein
LAMQYEAMAKQVDNPRLSTLGDRILGLTHHYLGNQESARRLMERVRRQAHESTANLNADFQYGPEVATTVILSRVYWVCGYPDQAIRTAQEAVDAALRAGHGQQVVYVMTQAGCVVSLLIGDLAEARRRFAMMRDAGAGNPEADTWSRFYDLIIKLRQSSERDALMASFIEPRIDLASMMGLAAMASETTIPLPAPGALYGEAEWSLPELMRIDAELLRHRGAPAEAAEAKLLESLEIARGQSTLSWELRTAMSLARLWREAGRAAEARDLVGATLSRFTEGFETTDLVAARRLIESGI